MNPKLILASSSPFRRMLMQNAGLSFEAHPAKVDERLIEAPLEREGATPDAIALVLAKAKAKEVSERFAEALVIGSDQTMSLSAQDLPQTPDYGRCSEPSSAAVGKDASAEQCGRTRQQRRHDSGNMSRTPS